MKKPKEDGPYAKFGDLLRILRKRTQLSQQGFINALTMLVLGPDQFSYDDSRKRNQAEKWLSDLRNLGADIEVNLDKKKEEGKAGDIFPYGTDKISRYEHGHVHVERERVLFFIYFFKQREITTPEGVKQKGIITLREADRLLAGVKRSPLDPKERAIIFGDEATSGNISQSTSTVLAAKQEESTAIVPVAAPSELAVEAEGETLIVIAAFHYTIANTEPHKKICRTIEAEAKRLGEHKLRVVIENAVLNADQRTEAEELGGHYNASMVIWGEDTGVQILVNFLYLRHPDFAAAVTTINETERTLIANPGEYNRFIVDDLPKRLTFLSLFAVGHKYYINQDYPRAATLIEEAIASLSNKTRLAGLAEAYYRLGWLYYKQLERHEDGVDYNKVIEINKRATELKPDYASAYNNRGAAYSEQGMFNEAIADYDRAIQLDPNLALAYNNRGFAYFEQGMFSEAIADYDRAIQLDPNLALAYNNRGFAYRAIGMFEEAIANYDIATQLDPGYDQTRENRGDTLSEQEMFKGVMLEKGFYIEKLESVKVGVIAFFESPKVEDIREITVKTALLNTIPDTLEFTSSYELVDPDGLSDDIIEPAKYVHRKSEISVNLLNDNEIWLAKKRNGICIFLAIGINPNGEKCFAYFSIRAEKINRLARMIQQDRIIPSTTGRVVHYGLDAPGKKDFDDMFDNWLFTARKTTVKYLTQKAGQKRYIPSH